MGTWTEFSVSDLSSGDIQAGVALAVAVGLLYCFLGYRLFRIVLGVTGFVLAGSVAGAFAGWLTHGKLIYMAVAGLLGGIAGAVALSFLYKVGVFCLGVLAGALIAQDLLGAWPDDWVASVVLGAGVFGGLCALVFERPIMTLATAAIGAYLTVQGLAFFVLGSRGLGPFPSAAGEHAARYVLLAFWAVLATVGAVTQSRAQGQAAKPKAGPK